MAEENTNTPPYYDAFDTESKGLLMAKGWDKLDPATALSHAITSYREAEKKLGVPADRVVRWPDPNDADGLKAIHLRLGAPETPEGYDFSGVKFADGTAPEDGFVNFVRGIAAQHNLTKEAAAGIAAAFVKFGEDAEAAEGASTASAIAARQQQLDGLWGANKDINKVMADRAAALLGISPDAMKAFENHDNYVSVMDGLRKIAVAMGEAKLVGNQGPTDGNGNRIMTREEAAHRKEQLMSDPTFRDRWYKGERAAIDELGNLDRIIVGGRAAA